MYELKIPGMDVKYMDEENFKQFFESFTRLKYQNFWKARLELLSYGIVARTAEL